MMALAGALLVPATWTAVAAADPTITAFDTGITINYSVAQGSDGAAWYTENYGNRISRITNDGSMTHYPIPTTGGDPSGITNGPDGNIWFTERDAGKVGKVDVTTGAVSEVATLPEPHYGNNPSDITTGPDGNLWLNENNENSSNNNPSHIVKVTPSGDYTEYTLPDVGTSQSITTGPDGALWFVWSPNFYANQTGYVGRITTSGVITRYAIPTYHSQPGGITTGPDGNLWFTEASGDANKVGRLTPTGVFTEWSLPTANAVPEKITTGPDGALWFTEDGGNKLGRITTSGDISEYNFAPATSPLGIASFSDGSLWVSGYSSMNHITLPPAAPVVSVTNPLANSTVSGTVNITGTINSASAYNLQLYVFNAASHAVVSRYQYAVPASTTDTSYSWDTTAVPNGNYTVILSAKDAEGHKNAGSTSTVHITVAN